MQFAKSLGAHVTALAGESNLEFARKIGADEAYNYRTTDVEDLQRFDVIVDAVGSNMRRFRSLLSPGGRMVALALDPDALGRGIAALFASMLHGSGRIRFFSAKPDQYLLGELTSLVESAAIRPYIDTCYPMDDTISAHRALETGGGRGKRIVVID